MADYQDPEAGLPELGDDTEAQDTITLPPEQAGSLKVGDTLTVTAMGEDGSAELEIESAPEHKPVMQAFDEQMKG